MNTFKNVTINDKGTDVQLGTLLWIGGTDDVYVLARMAGPKYTASPVSIGNGNLWHLESAEVKNNTIPYSQLKRIIGAADWGFVSEFTAKSEKK